MKMFCLPDSPRLLYVRSYDMPFAKTMRQGAGCVAKFNLTYTHKGNAVSPSPYNVCLTTPSEPLFLTGIYNEDSMVKI